VEKMSASMSGEYISPVKTFPALCGKGCTVFHTNQGTPKNLFVTIKNLFARQKNLFVTTKNLFARRKNLYVTPKNLCARRKNLYVTTKNLFARRKNLYVTPKNLCARQKNLYVTTKNLFAPGKNLYVMKKNLCARPINPRAACIYSGFVFRKPNAPAIMCLNVHSTNKAAVYSHVSPPDLNKTWLMNVKVPVNPCKRVNPRPK